MSAPSTSNKLRIGIVNLMPHAEHYEHRLMEPLSVAQLPFEAAWIRLASHSYASRDGAHIDRHYQLFDAALACGPLDGLIVTGAPVEELEFTEIPYWRELQDIMAYAHSHVPSTLGLCWGGMALAKQLDIDKVNFPKKLFGVFELRTLEPHALLGPADATFGCPQSRHAGVEDSALERAAADGRVRLLAHGQDTGYSLFESSDGRYVMQQGHPEYDAQRLVYEYQRDAALQRKEVSEPVNVDLNQPATSWISHRESFFKRWLLRCAQRRL
jgi:homoserine O-succinyltransferase